MERGEVKSPSIEPFLETTLRSHEVYGEIRMRNSLGPSHELSDDVLGMVYTKHLLQNIWAMSDTQLRLSIVTLILDNYVPSNISSISSIKYNSDLVWYSGEIGVQKVLMKMVFSQNDESLYSNTSLSLPKTTVLVQAKNGNFHGKHLRIEQSMLYQENILLYSSDI
jgi:hypothetical protein